MQQDDVLEDDWGWQPTSSLSFCYSEIKYDVS